MTDTLVQAYLPLLFWTGLGLVSFRLLPTFLPRLLGRSLYWVGVPLQIFTLARQTNFSEQVELVPSITVFALTSGLVLAWLGLHGIRWLGNQTNVASPEPSVESLNPWHDSARQGSFLIASMLGNTGFVGLAIAPNFIDEHYLSWLVFYSVTQNIVGTYGIGVLLSSYFGKAQRVKHWLVHLRNLLTVPSLWAFTLGTLTRSVPLPASLESGLHASIWYIIPSALLLMGMRISQLNGWSSLKLALGPTLIKVFLLPLVVGVLTTALGLSPSPRLALVLMAGMPTAFAGLILTEEYELDRELISSSIVLTTGLLLIAIPLWLRLFGVSAG